MNKLKRSFKLIIGLFIILSFYQCDNKTKTPIQKNNTTLNKKEAKMNTISQPESIPVKKERALTKEEQNIKAAEYAFQADLEKFILISCNPSSKIPSDKISIDLIKNYKNSYEKTHLEDGQSFCIHEIYNNENAISRILYSRTEGGHYGDMISLWSLNKKTNELKQLQLFSTFGKDGYQQNMTTEIKGNTFIITEIENSKTKDNLKTVLEWTLLENGDIKV